MSLRRVFSIVVVVTLMAAFSFAQTRSAKTLDIYVIDVEGGNATLFVPPSGEAVLIDTGNVGAAAGRAGRRKAESILFQLHSSGGGQNRECAVGRKPHHFWKISGVASRRSHLEQGVRPDVPAESHRHRRFVDRLASWAGHIELSRAHPCHPGARRNHEQWNPEGRTA